MNLDKIKKWQRILDDQISEFTDILERRFIFREVKKIVEDNPSINQSNIFHDYFRINYVYAQIIQLSRLFDQDPRTESFIRLLQNIEDNPEIFENEWRNEISKIANPNTSEKIISSAREKTLDTDIVSDDICKILCQFIPIKKYRDKSIAHKQAKGIKANLTFDKLDKFIDFIHERMLIYTHFLHASGYPDSGFMPEIQYDWREIFREPWIRNKDL